MVATRAPRSGAQGGRTEASPSRPCPSRADAPGGPLVQRLPGARTPPGRGVPGHPQAAGTEVGAGNLLETDGGKLTPGGASPSPPSDRQEAEAARGESKSRQKDAAREENSKPAPHSAARASLADAVSRLPFPRPTRRRHLVYRPAPRRRRTPQRRTRPLAALTCAAVGCSFKPRPSNPPGSPTRIGLFGACGRSSCHWTARFRLRKRDLRSYWLTQTPVNGN